MTTNAFSLCSLFDSHKSESFVSVELDFNISHNGVATSFPMLLPVGFFNEHIKPTIDRYLFALLVFPCKQQRSNSLRDVFVFNDSANDVIPVLLMLFAVFVVKNDGYLTKCFLCISTVFTCEL